MPIYHMTGDNGAFPLAERKSQDWTSYALLRMSPIALYSRLDRMARDVEAIRSEGFSVAECVASAWTSEAEMWDAVGRVVGGRFAFGCNMNALHSFLVEPGAEQLVDVALCVIGFDAYWRADPQGAKALLAIWASASRIRQLVGASMLMLVQTGDPDLDLPSVGGVKPWWNAAEFQRSRRLDV